MWLAYGRRGRRLPLLPEVRGAGGANKIEVEPKSDMKDKIGSSPDIADAIAVGVEGAVRLGFKVDSPVSKEYSQKTESWKTKLRAQAKESWAEGSLSYS